ncbi:MAG: PTS sugar transporter subunit IIB [Elusimicrobia bacterium]|nr:PTS sugar transporter subunit IIB [Elusimicrobiota bacterium]
MAVVLYRIDNRLVHAQVLEGWLPAVKANMLAVVNDDFVKDEIRMRIAERAVADHMRVAFWTLDQSPMEAARLDQDESLRAVLVFASPNDVLEFIRLGARPPAEVNIGGMHYAISRLSLGRYRTFSDQDREALARLLELGVRLDARATPTDEPVDLMSVIKS